MLYVLKVNFSLAAIGIRAASINSEFRRSMQAAGKASGRSPQEVAVWIAGQLPFEMQMRINRATIEGWIRKRKINPDLDEMREAFDKLGLHHLGYERRWH